MQLRIVAGSIIGGLMLASIPFWTRAQGPVTQGVYFVAYRTAAHIDRSSPEVFHQVANDLIAYLKAHDVNLIEDPERGTLQTSQAFSTQSLLNLTKNAGASSLLLVTVDRPMSSWLKVTIQSYDLEGKSLWSEAASSMGGMTGTAAPAKVLKSLEKALDARIGKPGLPTTAPAKISKWNGVSSPADTEWSR